MGFAGRCASAWFAPCIADGKEKGRPDAGLAGPAPFGALS